MFNYRVAGMNVMASHRAALSTDGAADGWVTIRFSQQAECLADDIPVPGGPNLCVVARDGKEARISGVKDELDWRAVQIRRVLPFAAALQGHLTLHACGLVLQDCAVAVVGESGVGKSTLARFLIAHWVVAADDLLPCRFRVGKPVVPLVDRDVRLGHICFMERDLGAERPRLVPLDPPEVMQNLLRHGFGELRQQAIWSFQFDRYGVLSKSVPGHRLTVPDDLCKLPDTETLLRELVQAS